MSALCVFNVGSCTAVFNIAATGVRTRYENGLGAVFRQRYGQPTQSLRVDTGQLAPHRGYFDQVEKRQTLLERGRIYDKAWNVNGVECTIES